MLDNLFGKKKENAAQTAQPKRPSEGAATTGTVGLSAMPQGARPHAAGAQPAAQAQAQAQAQAAETVNMEIQNLVDEAAIFFANGDEQTASDMLVQCLNKTRGNVDKKVWYMLLDMYLAMGKKDRFDQLSLHFANRFGTSPPPWNAEEEAEAPSAHMAEKQQGVATGKNVLILDGPLNAALGGRFKEFVAASREMKTCKIDISRVRIAQSDKDGMMLMQSMMSQLRKFKVSATLMGENHVVEWLTDKVAKTKLAADLNDSPYWILLLEVLQWRGLMEQFEELSLEYTMTFEVSGPGWETNGVMTIEASAHEVANEEAEKPEAIILDPLITDMTIQRMQEAINLMLLEKGNVVLDFHKVKRMDFCSAGAFLAYLSTLGLDPRKIIFLGPTELILALMDVVGVTPLVTIVPRKR